MKVNSKRARAAQARFCPLEMRGMIVEDHLDRGRGRIGGVEQLRNWITRGSVAILDQSMDLAGDEVDASEQADRAVAPVFMLA